MWRAKKAPSSMPRIKEKPEETDEGKKKVTEPPWYRAVYPAGGATIQWIKNEAAWSSEPYERGLIGILIVVPGERPVPECLHEVWRGCNTKAALQRNPLRKTPSF